MKIENNMSYKLVLMIEYLKISNHLLYLITFVIYQGEIEHFIFRAFKVADKKKPQ